MLDERLKAIDESVHLLTVLVFAFFFASCSFIDDYDIELMQDATASVETSSSEGNPSTSSETLSSSSREDKESSSSSYKEETSSSSFSSSSKDLEPVEGSSSSSEIASCSSKEDESSSSAAESSSSSEEEPVESSSSSIPSSSSVTTAFKCGNDFLDSRDNAKYATVKIGTQCWFAENLNYNAKNSSCYGDDDSNCEKYGRLYRWTEAQSACPDGSRLPTTDDWDMLLNYLGNAMVAGKYLKDESSWSAAEDAYGFSALPAGYYSEDDEDYVQIEQMAIFWSTAASGTDAEGYVLSNSKNNIENWKYPKTNKMSVRCLAE